MRAADDGHVKREFGPHILFWIIVIHGLLNGFIRRLNDR
jgi:hypothetical protein